MEDNKNKSIWIFVVLHLWVLCEVSAQICLEDISCDVDYFCDVAKYSCKKCLKCADLKREPSIMPECAKRVSECGLCLPGLMDDPKGEFLAPCVPDPSAPVIPFYLWISLAIGILLLIGLIVFVVYALRDVDVLRFSASTHARVQTVDLENAPPPPCCEPIPASSPTLTPCTDTVNTHEMRDMTIHPVVKRAGSTREKAGRERDSNQEASPFNNPYYVRGPVLTPSTEDAPVADVIPTPDLHDEDTMESVWTPGEETSHTPDVRPAPIVSEESRKPEAASSGSESSGASGTTQDPDVPPTKMLCLRQDSNNNANSRSSSDGEVSTSSAGPSGSVSTPQAPPTALSFNITVQQYNDLKLIRT